MSSVDEDYFDIYANNSNVGMLVLYSGISKRKIKADSNCLEKFIRARR